MQGALPILGVYGAVIIVSALLLAAIFLGSRSRRARRVDDEPPVAVASPTVVAPPSSPESVSVHLKPDGTVAVETEGKRFDRLEDIGEERLAGRVLAAAKGMQQFAGVPPEPKLTPAELTDELRAGHAPADGALVLEFRGQRYRRLIDIRDGETGRQLLAMIGELVTFAQGKILAAAPPASTKSGSQSEDEFLKQLGAPTAPSAPLRMPTLIEAVRRPSSKLEPMPIGIAGQIDKVLQEQLVDNASLRGRSIHVTTAPDGSLIIQIENRSFQWPDGVTDAAIREAVQRAIRAWEHT